MDKFRFLSTFFFNFNYAYILILALLVKAIISDVSYATFLLTIPVLGFEGYKLYIKSKIPEPVRLDAAVIKRLDMHKEELESIKSKLKAENLDRNLNSPSKRYF